jgi:hypothetical protein
MPPQHASRPPHAAPTRLPPPACSHLRPSRHPTRCASPSPLAQASRSWYVQAVEKGYSSGILETLAAETAAAYADAAAAVRAAVGARGAALRAPLALEWSKVPESLRLHFTALAHTHAAAAHAAAAEHGAHVGRLAYALEQAEAAVLAAPPSVAAFLGTQRDAAATAYATAKRDNDSIYYEPVVAPAALSPPRRPERRLVRARAPPELLPAASDGASANCTSPLAGLFSPTSH